MSIVIPSRHGYVLIILCRSEMLFIGSWKKVLEMLIVVCKIFVIVRRFVGRGGGGG